MRFLENPEQPELTGKDLLRILDLIFTCGEVPRLPDVFTVENLEHQTRLKFNAPTPVAVMDVAFCWKLDVGMSMRAHVLFWQIDQEWEVLETEPPV